jgi:hypothetical protein
MLRSSAVTLGGNGRIRTLTIASLEGPKKRDHRTIAVAQRRPRARYKNKNAHRALQSCYQSGGSDSLGQAFIGFTAFLPRYFSAKTLSARSKKRYVAAE